MLDACTALSLQYEQPETIHLLNPMYRNTWQNLIIIHGKNGDKKDAWYAFVKSLHYGFRLGSLKLLIEALY